jgi:hypothetical protein
LYFTSVEDQMVTVKYVYFNILADANDRMLYVHIVVSILVLPIHTSGPLMHVLGS